MPLPKFYKTQVHNLSGVTLDFDGADSLLITGIPWKLAADGVVTYGAKITLFSASADMADDAIQEGSEIENDSNLYIGMDCIAELSAESTDPDGPINIYLETNAEATSGQNGYPSDAADFDGDRIGKDCDLIGRLLPEGDGDDIVSTNFSIGGLE